MERHQVIESLKGGLVVSCQADAGDPFEGPQFMAAFAQCAAQGGAVGIRANGPNDITAIKMVVSLPVIGLYKIDLPGYAVRITPTLDSIKQIATAGADIIALDATNRPHPENLSSEEVIRLAAKETGLPILADISTFEEAIAAEQAGADAVSTTLSGYTPYSPQIESPDFEIVRKCSEKLSIPVFAEGRIATPDQAHFAIELGAYAVIIGTAITRPTWIVKQMAKGIQK